jgi:hypothetical protein
VDANVVLATSLDLTRNATPHTAGPMPDGHLASRPMTSPDPRLDLVVQRGNAAVVVGMVNELLLQRR